jgi:hypothetical protein
MLLTRDTCLHSQWDIFVYQPSILLSIANSGGSHNASPNVDSHITTRSLCGRGFGPPTTIWNIAADKRSPRKPVDRQTDHHHHSLLSSLSRTGLHHKGATTCAQYISMDTRTHAHTEHRSDRPTWVPTTHCVPLTEYYKKRFGVHQNSSDLHILQHKVGWKQNCQRAHDCISGASVTITAAHHVTKRHGKR